VVNNPGQAPSQRAKDYEACVRQAVSDRPSAFSRSSYLAHHRGPTLCCRKGWPTPPTAWTSCASSPTPAWTSFTSTRPLTATATTRSSGARPRRSGRSRTPTPAPRPTSSTCGRDASSWPACSREPAASAATATGTSRTPAPDPRQDSLRAAAHALASAGIRSKTSVPNSTSSTYPMCSISTIRHR